MSNLYSTEQKICIANSVIENACGNKAALDCNDQIFNKLHKIEKKYIKHKSYDLSDFAIAVSELPKKHFRLMLSIGWLDHETEKPQTYIDGFYSETYSSKQGFTQIQHYITIDKYIYLLFIGLDIVNIYCNTRIS